MIVEDIIELISIVFRLARHTVKQETEVGIEQRFFIVWVVHIAAEPAIFVAELRKGSGRGLVIGTCFIAIWFRQISF